MNLYPATEFTSHIIDHTPTLPTTKHRIQESLFLSCRGATRTVPWKTGVQIVCKKKQEKNSYREVSRNLRLVAQTCASVRVNSNIKDFDFFTEEVIKNNNNN